MDSLSAYNGNQAMADLAKVIAWVSRLHVRETNPAGSIILRLLSVFGFIHIR